MFLKSLKIEGQQGLIRKIMFRKGVNLIIDNSEGEHESGNNVGKTTILRLIDYCLGGKGENIFKDPEFGTISDVKDFLIEEKILLTLTLTKSLDSSESKTIRIERNFLPGSEKILRIDGEEYSLVGKNKFSSGLMSKIFDCDESKPTFRQIISKNIRDEKDSLHHVLKVLHQTTKGVEYEALYQFWFGIASDEASERQKTEEAYRKKEAYKTQLAKEFNTWDFPIIKELESSIHELNGKKAELGLNDEFKAKLAEFDDLKAELARTATRLSSIQLRIQLIEDSSKALNEDVSKVSVAEIARLYQEAKVLIPNLQKSFQESVEFHNEMIQNKRKYIRKELPNLSAEQRRLQRNLNDLEKRASEYRTFFRQENKLAALEEINSKLQTYIERHAKLSEQHRIWQGCLSRLDVLKRKKEAYTETAQTLNEQIEERLEHFNKILKRISIELYDEQYMLVRKEYDGSGKELETLQFDLRGVTPNPGTGEKKGQITAFDLAYIEYAEEMDIPHVNFILHDQIENVDGRQIITILEKLVPTINCQYIAPILRDKIPLEVDPEQYAIIELSTRDKLFRF